MLSFAMNCVTYAEKQGASSSFSRHDPLSQMRGVVQASISLGSISSSHDSPSLMGA